MNRPGSERQEWIDFAHTVDVLASSALAQSDMGEGPVRHRGGLRHFFVASRARRRTVGGIMAAACLLILALPAILLIPGTGNQQVPPSSSLPDSFTSPINLRLTLQKSGYQPGETLSYTLQANQACHPLVYSIGADNEVQLVDLTRSDASAGPPTPSLGADAPLTVTGASGQRPMIAPPMPGTYTIGAVCSRDPLANVGVQTLADAARQGKEKFLAYLAQMTERLKPDQLGDITTTYAVK